jgi:hypothetical protein
MTKPIGTDGDVSRGEPCIHQNARGIQTQGSHRRNLVGSCRSVAHVDVPPSPAGLGARGC